MEDQKTGFGKLSIKKTANIFYKQEPMAQIAAVIKKLKKNKKAKPSELAEMYNEKCISLCEQIETNKLEIENYKTIIFGLQKTLVDKDKEVEALKLELIKEKELINEGEEKMKNLSINLNIPNNSINNINNINNNKEEGKEGGNEGQKDGNDHLKDEMIQKLQSQIILLNKEKNEFNLKLLDKENDYKIYLQQKDNKVQELLNIIKEKDDKINELMNQYDSLNNNININDEKKPEVKEKEEKKPEIKKDEKDKDIEVEIPKQETEEHKLMNYNKILSENLFMSYLIFQ